jgi:hypothetical protein
MQQMEEPLHEADLIVNVLLAGKTAATPHPHILGALIMAVAVVMLPPGAPNMGKCSKAGGQCIQLHRRDPS